jgi:hypothetical protein
MYQRAIQLSLVLSLVAWPALVSARAPQAAATTTPAAPAATPAPATPPKKIVIVKVIQPKPAAPVPAAAATPAPVVAKAATPAATTTSAATSTATAPKAANGNSASSILSTIFGTGGSGSSTASAATSAATTAAGSTKAGATAASAAGTASATKSAVSGNSASGILTSIFGSGGVVPGASGKTGAGATGGKAGGAPTAPDGANSLVATTPDAGHGRGAAPASPAAAAGAERTSASGSGLPNGALGVAQFSDTILTVYGCTRQGTQVLCDADLSNQNKTETQVQSSVAWKDAFIIDDRGDRHQRSSGFFVNVDGDQRQAMDIPYGQSARYIFVFNDVSPKVQQVTLKSATGGLNVENIPVAGVSVTPNQGGTDQASGGAGAGHSQSGAPSSAGAAVPNL